MARLKLTASHPRIFFFIISSLLSEIYFNRREPVFFPSKESIRSFPFYASQIFQVSVSMPGL